MDTGARSIGSGSGWRGRPDTRDRSSFACWPGTRASTSPGDGVERVEPAGAIFRAWRTCGMAPSCPRTSTRWPSGRRRRVPGVAGRGVRRCRAAACWRAACACSTCPAPFVSVTRQSARAGTRRPACAAGRSRLRSGGGADRASSCDAQLVSCPGCYPTAAVLALGPLVRPGWSPATSSSTPSRACPGAGKAPSERTHFSECHGSVSAYGVFAHRHAAEIEQELGAG